MQFFRCFALRFLIILCFNFMCIHSASADRAQELVRSADDSRFPRGKIVFVVKAEDYAKGKKIRETVYRVYADGTGKSLVETLIPERQIGRKLLMVGNDLWFFSPDIKRPSRVSLQQKLTGEISNGDLANTDYAGDYDAKITGEEELNGARSYKLRLTAKGKTATYASIDYWIDQKTQAPVQAHFLSSSGKVMKIGYYDGLRDVMGRKRVTRFRVQDAHSRGRTSILIYSQHKKSDFDDSIFSKEAMQ